MKTQKQFEGTFENFIKQVAATVPKHIIESRLSAFEECYDLGLTPQKSIEFLILGN